MWYWLVPVIVIALLIVYMIYRMSRDEEMEPGGSWGEQLGGKKSDEEG